MNVSALLAFIQFGSPGMLLWALAAALPLLIHLWSRRRHRQEPWAAMSFLLAALRATARRIQLEQWVLLAIRTAILLLFAVALADPKLPGASPEAGSASDRQTHVVLIIDGSYSMDYRESGKARFERAKELAAQRVREGQEGESYSLVLMAEPPCVIIAQPAFDREAVLVEIVNLELTHAGANLAATLAEVEVILQQAIDRQPQLARRHVCLFTDMQQSTWAEANAAAGRAQLARLERLASLELVDMGQSSDENLAVTGVDLDWSENGLITAGSVVQMRADIQSYARENRSQQGVRILVDGQPIADERVDVVAGGRASISASHRFDTLGDHIVEVQLDDDALPLDNRRWLVVPVRESLRVLCIGGRPSETKHLALALAPSPQSSSRIEVVQAAESRLLEGDLLQFDCLFLTNIGRFSSEEAASLHRYVNRGGALVVFLGDQVQIDNYNQALVDNPTHRILPARLIEQATYSTAGYALDSLEYRHPIAAPFRGFPQSGLLTTPIWKYVRLQVNSQPPTADRRPPTSDLGRATTALAFTSGDPAIVASPIGRGRCILVATAASTDSIDRTTDPPRSWTALPSWPSFPPLIHEMLRYAISHQHEHRNLLVGDELHSTLPATASVNGASASAQPSSPTVTITGPALVQEQVPLAFEGAGAVFRFTPTAHSGIYEARLGDLVQRFAVNLDTSESELTRLNPEHLRSLIQHKTDEQAVPATGTSAPFFRWLLAAVLALLVAEPCVAWSFARRRV
jgi:hypothetical protein